MTSLAPALPLLSSATEGPGQEAISDATDATVDAVEIAVDKVEELTTGVVGSIPALVIGLAVLALFWIASRLVARLVRPRIAKLRGDSLAQVLTSIISATVKAVGALVFLAVVFPSVNVGTMLGAGGALALAAGFAFRDIFENLMAGLLLLMRQPFAEGDIIEVEGVEGVVEAITIRETLVRRFDRQLVQVPNATVYKGAICVQTDSPHIMTTVVVGVGYDDDLQLAEDVAVAAMRDVEGVLDDPPPEAFYTAFGDSSINLDLRFFHDSNQHDLMVVQGRVVKAVKRAYDEQGIDIPFPIRTLDATDEVAATVRSLATNGAAAGSDDGARPAADRA